MQHVFTDIIRWHLLRTGWLLLALTLSWQSSAVCQEIIDRPFTNYFDQSANSPLRFDRDHFDLQEARRRVSAGYRPVSTLDSLQAVPQSLESQMQYQFDLRNPTATDSPYAFEWQPIRQRFGRRAVEFGEDFANDHRHFYSRSNFRLLLGAFAIGAATANTPFDESLREVLHDNLVYTASDEYAKFLHENRYLGDGYILLPAYLALAVVGKGLLDDPNAYVVGEWGERSIRSILVGAPVLLLSQSLTGGSRPDEASYSSDWRPFRDDNGVSGHAFMGAIPFLTAAHMSNNRWAKAGFIAASTLPGLSRITDDRHYPSQVFLGWTLAYMATSAIGQTEPGSGNVSFAPLVVGDSMGLGVTIKR